MRCGKAPGRLRRAGAARSAGAPNKLRTRATCSLCQPPPRAAPARRRPLVVSLQPRTMRAVQQISAEDRELMKRLSIVFVFVFLAVGAVSTLNRLYSHKFYDVTGRAQWIWDPHPM